MRVRIIQPTVKIENKKKRVCAYTRVSTNKYKQEESLENQIQYYEKLIKNNPTYEYVGVFTDKAISGTKDKRLEFEKMIESARNREIDLIITKSISRFARNTTIMLETVRELRSINVEVRFEKENINTLSGDGELMLAILSSFAQEESKNVSDNVKWRLRKKFEKGEVFINTNRFLGYDKDEYRDLIINQEEANIVKRIFEEYLKGKGTFTIVKELNSENIKSVGKAKWHETTILGILKNEKYKGDAILQKYYISDYLSKKKKKNNGEVNSFYIKENHAAIIEEEMWEKVQLEIRKRAIEKGNIIGDTDKYTNRYSLTGKLYCSKCGATLRRRTWNSKLECKKIVWQCSNYIRNGKNACEGTVITDEVASRLNIKEETIVEEIIKNGTKHYRYTGKSR